MPLPFAVRCLPFWWCCWYICVISFGFRLHLLSFSCLFLLLCVFFTFHFALSFRLLHPSFIRSFGSHDFCFILYLCSLIHLFGLMVLSQSPLFPFVSFCFSFPRIRTGQPFCSFDVRSLKRCGRCETAARCFFIGWLVIKSNTKAFYFFHLMVFILFVLLFFLHRSLSSLLSGARGLNAYTALIFFMGFHLA